MNNTRQTIAATRKNFVLLEEESHPTNISNITRDPRKKQVNTTNKVNIQKFTAGTNESYQQKQ